MAHPSRVRHLRIIHPAALVVLALATVVLLWLNLRVASAVVPLNLDPVTAAPPELDPLTRYLFFRGWPLSPFEFCAFHGMSFHPEESPVRLALVLNWLLAVLILLAVGVASEWLVRQLQRRPSA